MLFRSVSQSRYANGGGSFEDLLPFSDEGLVRLAANCKKPIVSAIGHEQDTPLLDLVADLAIKRGTGARGLRAIMEETLMSVMYEVPSKKDVGKVVVNAKVVLKEEAPTYLPRANGPKRAIKGEKRNEEKSA